MCASQNGHLDIVRTLLECGGDVNAQNKVRNQMMIMMMMMMMMMVIMMMMMMMMMVMVISH